MNIKLITIMLLLIYNTNSAAQGRLDKSEIKRKHIQYINNTETNFDINKLSICSNYGCSKITDAKFSAEQWIKISSILEISAVSPAMERAALAEVMGYIETIIGRQTNTQYDVGGTFNIYVNPRKAKSEQMDCIDESANTLLYLRFLDQEQKIVWHDVVGLSSRGGLRAGYPHTAVLLIDKDSKQKYIIDSWFYDNGRPATIVPYQMWKRGWKPGK
jgi:hypothetical protein